MRHSIEQTIEDNLPKNAKERAAEIQKLQVMFMSMGEPLLNLKALIPALYKLHEMYPHARLLISTAAPKISDEMWIKLVKASREIPTVGLQFSVHESTDEA